MFPFTSCRIEKTYCHIARHPNIQSATRSRPVGAARRLNPQSATRSMHNRCKRSNLELRGPRNGLKVGP
eukprot:4359991-Alexandrium_andersonii.AAC.1